MQKGITTMIKCAVYNCANRADGQDEVVNLTFELDIEVPLCSEHRTMLLQHRKEVRLATLRHIKEVK